MGTESFFAFRWYFVSFGDVRV